ncbi:hypothetical protein [Sporosarcina aquimarina]|uniref:Uncharacterized protein n=1 Tax=Sporosarcina aquimarina TaxID=114975 RepID=A0ABU4G2E6_9BACL|nr:hypothetical protein [Sporosarcina aquimarina]MDW0110530.1 hypothetical protein [Sporosarcina aquimarina]
MEEKYVCTFIAQPPFDEIDIECKGEGQELHFTLAIGFFSVPSFLYQLSRLWKGKTDTVEMGGFGNAVNYYFKIVDRRLLIEEERHFTHDEKSRHYDFDFECFVKSVDQGLKDFIKKQMALGEYPLKVNYSPHLLEPQNMKEYEEFSSLINRKRTIL